LTLVLAILFIIIVLKLMPKLATVAGDGVWIGTN